MDKKQVFNKVFMNEDEILDKMLKEAEAQRIERKDLIRRLLHTAGIHFYESKKSTSNHKVGKCKMCGKYGVGSDDDGPRVVFGIVAGIMLAILGIAVTIAAILPPFGIIPLIIGIVCLIISYLSFRIGLTTLFWD